MGVRAHNEGHLTDATQVLLEILRAAPRSNAVHHESHVVMNSGSKNVEHHSKHFKTIDSCPWLLLVVDREKNKNMPPSSVSVSTWKSQPVTCIPRDLCVLLTNIKPKTEIKFGHEFGRTKWRAFQKRFSLLDHPRTQVRERPKARGHEVRPAFVFRGPGHGWCKPCQELPDLGAGSKETTQTKGPHSF